MEKEKVELLLQLLGEVDKDFNNAIDRETSAINEYMAYPDDCDPRGNNDSELEIFHETLGNMNECRSYMYNLQNRASYLARKLKKWYGL